MSEAEETQTQQDRPHLLWWITLGYTGVVSFGWLVLALRRLVRWRTAMAAAEQAAAAGDAQQVNRINEYAGSLLVDMGYGLAVMAVCGFIALALSRRSWNAWDYATVAAGFATVLSAVFLCARDRVMFVIPFTVAPLLALLYTPGVKQSCGVRPTAELPSMAEPSIAPTAQQDIERELARERHLVAQLRQNLDVFEVERGISTDTFVDRYVNGLEDETPDNAEWFSIARAVRRSQERIAELQAQVGKRDEGRGARS